MSPLISSDLINDSVSVDKFQITPFSTKYTNFIENVILHLGGEGLLWGHDLLSASLDPKLEGCKFKLT